MAEQRVDFKGTFNVTEILNAIKQMRSELAKTGKSPMLGNLDKEIAKIEELGTTLQAQINKGFASNKEMKNFSNQMERLDEEARKIGETMKNINADHLESSLKNVVKQITDLKSKAAELTKSFNTDFTTSVKGNIQSDEGKDIVRSIREAAKAGREYKDVIKDIKTEYDALIAAQQQEVATAQANVANVKPQLAPSGFRANQFRDDSTGLNINANQLSYINNQYEAIIRTSNDATKAAKDFNDMLKMIGVTAKSTAPEQAVKNNAHAFYGGQANSADLARANKELQNQQAILSQLQSERTHMLATMQQMQGQYNQTTNAVHAATTAEQNQANAEAQLRTNNANLSSSINTLNSNINKEAEAWKISTSATAAAVDANEKMNQSFDNLRNRITYIFSLGNAFYQVKRVLQSTLEDAKNIDKAFASIAMVTEKTVSGLWERYREYADLAQSLGQSTESAIKASALFYQQGLKDKEVMELTTETMKLATLAGLDFEKATSQMTAALRGFHMEMDQGAHVTDVYSELAAHAAADVNGIAYAMSKTASIANNAGMAFETTAAFLTQMIETTQEAPENIGTAMKTIIARFTELKQNVAGTAESEFEDLDYNKVDKALKSVGVSIKDATGQFRNLDDVFLELSSKWDTLDRNSQRYIATIAAGSRQQSRFIAMMENYDRVAELIDITADSEGRANEQFAKNAESLQFKIQSLKTAWEKLRIDFTKADFFKGIVDKATGFVNIINDLSKKPAKLTATFTSAALVLKSIFSKTLTGLKQEIPAFRKSIADLFAKTDKNSFGIKVKLDTAYFEQQLEEAKRKLATTSLGADHVKMLDESGWTMKDVVKDNGNVIKIGSMDYSSLSPQEQQILNGYVEAKINLQRNEAAQQRAQAVGSALGTTITTAISTMLITKDPFKAAQSVWMTGLATMIPQILKVFTTLFTAIKAGATATAEWSAAAMAAATAGITLLITAATAGIMALIGIATREKKTLDAQLSEMDASIKEMQERAEEAKKDYQSKKESADNLEKLMKDYDELSNKLIKTTEEQEKYKEVVDQIREEFPEIVTSYDEITGQLTVQRDLWDAILQKQKESAIIAGKSYLGERVGIEKTTKKRNSAEMSGLSNNLEAINGLSNLSGFGEVANAWRESGYTTYDDIKNMATSWAKTANEQGANFKVEDILDALGVTDSISAEKLMEDLAKNDNLVTEKLEEYYKTKIKNAEDEHKTAEELAKKQTEAATALAVKDNYDVSEAVASFISKAEGMYEKGERDVNEYKRGYLANSLLGGVEGRNLDSSDKAFTGDNFAAWSDITDEEVKDALLRGLEAAGKNLGDYESLRKDKTGQEQIYQYYLEGLNLKDADKILENAQEVVNGLDKYEREKIDDFQANGGTYSQSQLEDFINLFDDDDERAIAKQLAQVYKDAFKAAFEGDEGITKFLNLKPSEYKDWSAAQAQTLQKALQKAYDEIDNADMAKVYFDNVENILRDAKIDPDDWAAYLQIDFSKIDSTTNREKWVKDQVEAMREAGYECGSALIESLLSAAEEGGRLDLVVDTLAEATTWLEKMKETSDAMYKATGDFVSVMAEQVAKGEVSLDNYMKLKKDFEDMGKSISDYVSIDENGTIIADEEALKMLYAEEVGLQKQKIQQKIDELKLEDAELANQEALIDAQIEAFDAGADTLTLNADINNSLEPILKNWEKIVSLVKEYNGEELDSDKYDFTASLDFSASGADKEAYKQKLLALKESIGTQRTELAGAVDLLEQEFKDIDNLSEAQMKDFFNKYDEALEKYQKEIEETEKAMEDLEKKIKALNDALYGDEYHKNKTDMFYNYTTALSKLTSEANKAKSALESLREGEDPTELLDQYTKNAQAAASARAAQNIILGDAIDSYEESLIDGLTSELEKLNDLDPDRMISTNVEDFFHIDDLTGRWMIDYNALNEAMLPDNISDYVEDSITQINKWMDEMDKNVEEEEKLTKEIEDMRDKALSNMISLEDEVIKVLKDKYQQEIDAAKEKYDALAELNDEYLKALEEAIDKERDLRDRENAENELATKEKKLSLMMRDTSGANQKEVAELNKEIEEDRQNLLDETIDNMLELMKENYDEQKEANEEKIALLEDLKSDAEIMKEAVGIISSWQNVDDMIGWMFNNNVDIESMSDNKLEQAINQWQQNYRNADAAQAILSSDLIDSILPTNDSINRALDTYSTPIETEAERLLNQTIQKASDSIIAAQKAVQDAQEKANKNSTTDHTDDINRLKQIYESSQPERKTNSYNLQVSSNDMTGNQLKTKTETQQRQEWMQKYLSAHGVSKMGWTKNTYDTNHDGTLQIPEMQEFLRRNPDASYTPNDRWQGLLQESLQERNIRQTERDNIEQNKGNRTIFQFNIDVDNNGEPIDEVKLTELLKQKFVEAVQQDGGTVILND